MSVALESKLGPSLLCAAGAAMSTGWLLWLATLPAHSAYAAHMLGPTLLFGIGFGSWRRSAQPQGVSRRPASRAAALAETNANKTVTNADTKCSGSDGRNTNGRESS